MTVVESAPVELPATRVEQPDARGVVRIADARVRQHVTLAGTIRATQTVTAGSSPLYRCVLADGSGEADLLFLGRSRVGGLTAGTCCRAEGRATVRRGRLALWNPRYQAGPSPRPGRALVADDQQSMRGAELSLTAHGYEVDAAATGASAVERVRQRIGELVGRVRAALPSAAAGTPGQRARPPN
jgi:RecG-like helicase